MRSPLHPSSLTLHPRRSHASALAWASAAALVLALAVALVLLLSSPPKQRQRLAEGSTLILEGASYGTRHQFDPRPWWLKLLRPNAPPGAGLLRGASFRTTTDTVVAWLLRDTPPTVRRSTGLYGVIVDEHGCWFEPSSSDWGFIPARPVRQIQQVGFNAFPRSALQLRLGLFDSYGRGPAASFTLRSPAA